MNKSSNQVLFYFIFNFNSLSLPKSMILVAEKYLPVNDTSATMAKPKAPPTTVPMILPMLKFRKSF